MCRCVILVQQELAFSRGDVIAVYGDADDDGFYFGELDGRSGLVPSNFLQEAPLGFIASWYLTFISMQLAIIVVVVNQF